ncbi:hypothetical protein JCM3766R1_002927 [Sporobolomyces carnicolor]
MSSTMRQLGIKAGVVKRLVKEVASYKQEAEQTKATADKMAAEGQDEYEVKQARRIHADSLQMIPDSEKRLAKAIEELEELVEGAEDEVTKTDEFAKAQASLESAKSE